MEKIKRKSKMAIVLNLITVEDALKKNSDLLNENFKNFLEKGISGILIEPQNKKENKFFPLKSFLGFDNLKDSNYENIQENNIEKNEMKIFQYFELEEEDFNEEIEINFNQNIKKYKEISYKMNILVLTNNISSLKFCHEIEINYMYCQNFNSLNLDIFLQEYFNKKYDIIIIDFYEKYSENFKEEINSIAKHYKPENLQKEYNYHIILTPVFQSYSDIEIFSTLNNNKFENKEIEDDIKDLIPEQSWKFNKGELNQIFKENQEKIFSYHIYFDIEGSRYDLVNDFKFFNLGNNFHQIGNKYIYINHLLREITFKLGKIPKYGA